MNSSKQRNNLLETRKRHFANADVTDVPRYCNPANFKPHLMPNSWSELHTIVHTI